VGWNGVTRPNFEFVDPINIS